MADGQKPNKPLFSQHYLEHRIQECPEWQSDIADGFGRLKALYQSKKNLLPTLSEAQTEDVFIKPALEILGFSYIPQVVTRGKGRAERPDYALFSNEADRDSAYPLQSQETAFYSRVTVIAEAKYWERPLSKVSANDQRDLFKNENPSFQITNYLTGTEVDWGILTNGREWRLYYRQASSTATEFYPVDLVALLEADDLEPFKYFWLFFRRAAFEKDPHGKNFLERVRDGSTTYATKIGNELKALVFDRVFPGLAGGFVTDAVRRKEQVTAVQVHEATLSFLYKLLFLLYAEARNLLPIDRDYRDYSLIKLTQAVAQDIDRQKQWSQTSSSMYDRLLGLFQIVDRGDAGLGVPRYNGGLFHFEFNQSSDQVEYRANYFLNQFKLADAVLAPVLDKLARFEGNPIDYSFLGVRQLGSIYEGLLEYRVVIEDAPNGTVQLENDKGDRKATGSYYTPDYIVKYIVSHTLKPILAQRQARFGALMAQIAQLHQQMQDKRLGVQSLNGMRKELQRLERDAQSTLLDIKVCDPAMGSGHFLVEAVDYLTDELIRILTLYPEQNPVLEMLEQTRQSILQNLEQQGITINPDRLEPTQLLQRVVMKRCIYGVDLNPMAVELAKVSLWLHSFTIGAPLSFLDHHLRCGNSLIGTTAREAEAAMSQESSGQFNLLTGPFVGLLRAAEIMRGVSVLSDATFAEVEQSETLFRSFDAAAKPYKRLLDIYVSKFFGLKRADHFLRVFGTTAILADPKTMNTADAAVYDDAQTLSNEKHFFHWDLEFPEVFIDLENASWKENAGFDTVIGNPPYVRQESLGESKIFFQKIYDSYQASADLYVYFVERGLSLIQHQGKFGVIVSNKFIKANYGKALRNFLVQKSHLDQIIDFALLPVFPKITVRTSILIANKSNSNNRQAIFAPIRNLRFQSLDIEVDEVKKYLSPDSLKGDTWSLVDNAQNNIIEKIEKFSIELKTYSSGRMRRGIITGLNEALLIDSKTKADLIKADARNAEVIKPLIVGSDIDHYEIRQENEKFILLIKADTCIAQYPHILQHLTQFQEKLEKRWDKGNNWYELRPCSYYAEFENPKIIYPDIAATCRFTYDDSGFYSTNTTYFISLKDFYLLSVLNSSLSYFYFKAKCAALEDAKRQSYLRFFGQYIELFPVRKINFTTPTDRRQQALESAIALYNAFQLDHDPDPLLAQVDHYLSQQPEEADVIHDLLAHLAEQMIALNKQKQTEIKSFLQWLERFIGCAIDTLNNKAKIQNYLGDYYKKGIGNGESGMENDTGEPHLSFDGLLELLKKNKKKIKIDPVARKEQQTLENEYQASLEILLPLKLQLMRCDRLIDVIVYKLYGLTGDEVAIVQGTRPAIVERRDK